VSTCSVCTSTTSWNAPAQDSGGDSRSALTYSTAEPGNRRRAVATAVGDTSKATVVKPSDATCSASSPSPQPITMARPPPAAPASAETRRGFGARSAHGTLVAAVRDILREVAGGMRGLLLVDNCEHVVAEAAEIVADLLTAGVQLRVLATSREPLGVPGEAIYQVQPLPVSPVRDSSLAATAGNYDAVRMFVDRAATASPGFTLTDAITPAVAALCQRLDGSRPALTAPFALGRSRGAHRRRQVVSQAGGPAGHQRIRLARLLPGPHRAAIGGSSIAGRHPAMADRRGLPIRRAEAPR
jgi:hypothetical protein